MAETKIADPGIEVSINTPRNDTWSAAARYLTVLVAGVPALLAAVNMLLTTKDFASFIAWWQTATASSLLAAVIGIGTIIWGLVKTNKRGQQVTDVAVSKKVPESVATIV